ncbi:MAG: uL15 family ribosomal protein [Candidatus Aenigmarchaeota archaeon]|nr:uL15 family ribosomal protein [Candidatus Aenigmarchaeota archaeon]
MVVRRNKKIRKQRATRTCGYGSTKKHRGKGSRGGRGKAGLHKQKKTWMVVNDPNHYGKKGFIINDEAKNVVMSVTVRELDVIARNMKKTEINVSELGFDKVISKGKLTQPLTITVSKITAKAKQKIEESGGKVIESA